MRVKIEYLTAKTWLDLTSTPRQALASEMNSDALPFLGGAGHFRIFIV